MEPAQGQQIGQVGIAAVRPVSDMVAFGAMRGHTAAGEPAGGVACLQRQPLSRRDGAARAPDVDRDAVPLGDRDKLGVAPDAAGDRSRKSRTVLHPAATRVWIVNQRAEINMDHEPPRSLAAWSCAGQPLIGHLDQRVSTSPRPRIFGWIER